MIDVWDFEAFCSVLCFFVLESNRIESNRDGYSRISCVPIMLLLQLMRVVVVDVVRRKLSKLLRRLSSYYPRSYIRSHYLKIDPNHQSVVVVRRRRLVSTSRTTTTLLWWWRVKRITRRFVGCKAWGIIIVGIGWSRQVHPRADDRRVPYYSIRPSRGITRRPLRGLK